MAKTLVFNALKELAQQELRLVAGAIKDVEKLSATLEHIQAVLEDAEEQQVRNGSVKVWLEDLKNVAYDIEDVCDEWRIRNSISHIEGLDNAFIRWCKRVCSYFSPCFGFFGFNLDFLQSDIGLQRLIGHKIKDIREKLDEIARDRNQFNFNSSRSIEERVRYDPSSSVITSLKICGRVKDCNIITNMLLGESSSTEEMGLPIISIVGMGGIGKTTLAQQAYHDQRVKDHFRYRIWVCVSEPFDWLKIAKEIIKGVGENVPNDSSWNILHNSLCNSLKDKMFLLVLDDVWTDNYRLWEPLVHSLKLGAPGSRILVTTRNERVAQMMGVAQTSMHRLGILPDTECWSLLRSIAFEGREEEQTETMEEISMEIAKKCKGLPLSAKTLGGLLRTKRTKSQWQNVSNSEIWDIKEVEEDILPALLLSYYDLPSHLKRCLQYCAIFPKDYEIWKEDLIKLWMAQGFIRSEGGGGELEARGEEYFSDLAMRLFFQDFKKYDDDDGHRNLSCKMDDLVHDFVQFLTKNECFIIDSTKNARDWNCKTKARHLTVVDDSDLDSTLSSISNFKNLRTLKFSGRWRSLHALPSNLLCHLTCLRALDLSGTSIKALPSEVEKLIHLRYLDLSFTDLSELPETVCNLYNLQTLDLSNCEYLDNLPDGIGKLISLRHLYMIGNELRYLPRGIGRLSSLQTLSNFIVGGDAGGCKIGDLKNLNLIRGNLRIEGLGYEANVNDAKEAGMINKQYLRSLELSFNSDESASVGGELSFNSDESASVGGGEEEEERIKGVIEGLQPHPNLETLVSFSSDESASVGGGEEEEERMKGVIEGLQPHPNLETLNIEYYRGTKLPKNWLILSSSLVSLTLDDCKNLMQLTPSLGKLPSLQRLELNYLDAVTNVGREFFGIGDSHDGVSFPKLTSLEFEHLRNWEEWDMTTRFKDDDISIMPHLNSLSLFDCPKLKALPHHFLQKRALEALAFCRCPILSRRYQKEVGEDWSKISHIPDMYIDEAVWPRWSRRVECA